MLRQPAKEHIVDDFQEDDVRVVRLQRLPLLELPRRVAERAPRTALLTAVSRLLRRHLPPRIEQSGRLPVCGMKVRDQVRKLLDHRALHGLAAHTLKGGVLVRGRDDEVRPRSQQMAEEAVRHVAAVFRKTQLLCREELALHRALDRLQHRLADDSPQHLSRRNGPIPV